MVPLMDESVMGNGYEWFSPWTHPQWEGVGMVLLRHPLGSRFRGNDKKWDLEIKLS